jgi:endonuclease/exonuclease/phosphatase family metal-dependent hydrolase
MKRLIKLILVGLLLSAVPLSGDSGSASVIKVMTRNEYLGSDLTPVIVAQTPEEFAIAADRALRQIAANDFPTRARGLAREVLLTQPDVIGLQEVYDYTVNGRNTAPPFVDHLQQTLNALSALGLHYAVASTVSNLDVTLPVDVDGDSVPEAVRVLDRDVILVRTGLSFHTLRGSSMSGGLCGVAVQNPAPIPPLPMTLSSTPSQDGCTYTIVASVNSPLGPIVAKRGFSGIDVSVNGKTYRVVNTHLELQQLDPTNPGTAIIQYLQSVELVGTLKATTPSDRTLIALGDFNSTPVSTPVDSILPPYQVMVSNGFADGWRTNPLALLDRDGFTCCQREDLSNKTSQLSERDDHIFVRTGTAFLPLEVVTGQIPLLGRSKPPFWASDHGGVFGLLAFLH